MIRSFDLAMEQERVVQLLNDPHSKLLKLKISCSQETGFTTAFMRVERVEEPILRKRRRAIERHILFNGLNPDVDVLMRDPNIRILNNYEFVTAQGVIIVIDYEIKKARS